VHGAGRGPRRRGRDHAQPTNDRLPASTICNSAGALVASVTTSWVHRLRGSFGAAVVGRGEDYARRGRVRIVEGSARFVEAVVRGSRPYKVSLEVERSGAATRVGASCACPYFEDDLCKHIWATLCVAARGGHLTEGAKATGVVPSSSIVTHDDDLDDDDLAMNRERLEQFVRQDPGLVDRDRRYDASAKMEALSEQLSLLIEQGKKALVFSQFTTFLDIVERELEARKISFTRLDGKTSDRKERVARFQTDPNCSVCLVSLKAGGLGLNLTAAEYVFLLDPWWNPTAEAQAIDRAHRMGQTRSVVSYRLLCKDTVEDRIALLQDKKRALVASVFSETGKTRLGSLSIEDVEALLS
jgi:Helicase conserved C-terminal domain/SWIM zinc finger